MSRPRIPDSASCSSCRHAQRLSEEYLSDSEKELHRRYPLACTRTSMSGGEPDDPQTLAFSMDGSSYRADLLVSANFACVMYEHGEPQAPQK